MPATGRAAEIIQALFARCDTLSIGSPAMPVAYPEPTEAFEIPSDGKYLEVAFFSNRSAWEGLSEGKIDQGLLQITVVWPKGQGVIAPANAAQKVMDHFAKGLSLIAGSTRVVVNKEPWASPPMPNDIDCRIAVTVPWAAGAAA